MPLLRVALSQCDCSFNTLIFGNQIINDRSTRGKCYGFVTFTNPRSAVDAIKDMDGRVCSFIAGIQVFKCWLSIDMPLCFCVLTSDIIRLSIRLLMGGLSELME